MPKISDKPVILIVDDEPDLVASLVLNLEEDFKVVTANNGKDALDLLKKELIAVVVADIRMPGMDGLSLLTEIKRQYPDIEVIMQTAVADVPTTVKAMKLGAYDYVVKPCEPEQLINMCQRAVEKRELVNKTLALEEQLAQYQTGEMIGKSRGMQQVFALIKKVASKDMPILIIGETGTGKELVARALHQQGDRAEKPFIAINCGAIPAELLESELFGHERGAFTSADARKLGKFELANGGTLFLDEIGTMPKTMQVKLLRVLQQGEIERVGGMAPIPIDLRIVSATNVKIKEAVDQGSFRDDLFHRLNVITIELPPLRERGNDILLLAQKYLIYYAQKYGSGLKQISDQAIEHLLAYRWPGNVRELEHVLQRIAALEDDITLLPRHLPLDIVGAQPIRRYDKSGSLSETVATYEKELIQKALEEFHYNIAKVAKHFNMHRTTLTSKIQSYNIKTRG